MTMFKCAFNCGHVTRNLNNRAFVNVYLIKWPVSVFRDLHMQLFLITISVIFSEYTCLARRPCYFTH